MVTDPVAQRDGDLADEDPGRSVPAGQADAHLRVARCGWPACGAATGTAVRAHAAAWSTVAASGVSVGHAGSLLRVGAGRVAAGRRVSLSARWRAGGERAAVAERGPGHTGDAGDVVAGDV